MNPIPKQLAVKTAGELLVQAATLAIRRASCAALKDSGNDLIAIRGEAIQAVQVKTNLNPGERVRDVRFTEDTLAVDLIDGRTIIVPLAWYPRLRDASPEQRLNWKISGAGYGIHWPDIDEDLSTEGLLRGAPSRPSRSAQCDVPKQYTKRRVRT